jgi:anti-sigma factor RsiW
MSTIEPSELSAYLDGELSADHRRVVAAALVSDSALRAEFDALANADVAWRRAAQTASFTPSIRMPEKNVAYISTPTAVVLAVVLVVLKLAPKFADGGVALAVVAHAVALVLALAGIAWLARLPTIGATGSPR